MLKEGLNWCGLAINKEKCRVLVFKKKKMVQMDEGIKLDDSFTAKCGLKEGARFLGLDINVCKSKHRACCAADEAARPLVVPYPTCETLLLRDRDAISLQMVVHHLRKHSFLSSTEATAAGVGRG